MEHGSDGSHCALLSMSISLPTEKQLNCSDNSSTHSTIQNMANYPDNDLSEADIDKNKQQVQHEVSINCQQVTTHINGDLDLSMSPTTERSVTTISVNGKTVLNDKIEKDDEDFDNTSDNDALIIDEERLSVTEDKNKHKITEQIDNSGKGENLEQISKHTEDIAVMPEHSNPYFSESIFELLNKKTAGSISKKKSSINKANKSSQDRQSNRQLNKDYAQYLGLQPSTHQLLKCARCNLAGFPTVTMLNDHLVKCGPIGNFSVGNTGNVGMDNFKNNNRLNKKIFLCSTCATYHTQADLFLHILHTHRRYVCLYCQGMFPGAERLARHLGNRHGAYRYQKQASILKEQKQPSDVTREQSYNNNNVNKCVDNGVASNREQDPIVLRDSGGSDVCAMGSKDNNRNTLFRRYNNMQEFRKKYKEECYLVCCGCERVFSAGIRGRDGGIGEGDRELEGHVCEHGDTTATLPSPLPQPPVPRLTEGRMIITDPSVEDNNASQISPLNAIETAQQQHPDASIVHSSDNIQSLKSNIDKDLVNTQTPSPAHGDSIGDIRENSGDICPDNNEDIMGDPIQVHKNVDRVDDKTTNESVFAQNTSPPLISSPSISVDSTQPDTRKVPKVTLKLTKPYQAHNLSDYSDSDSYLSDENNGNESSDSDKLMMQVDVEGDMEEGRNSTHLDYRDTEHKEDNTEDGIGIIKELEIVKNEEEALENQTIGELENKVAQIDGGADDESTADAGVVKLGEETPLDQAQQAQEFAVAGNDVPVLELEEMLEQPLDKMEPQSLIRHMLLTSVPHCLYCNHTRVIPVEGRQLALHALSEHRYSATVRSITAEELIPDSFNARLRECMPDLQGRYFNLQDQPQSSEDEVAAEESVNSTAKGKSKVRFECFQCRYQTGIHKELYQHNRKLHSKALLLCIMCKTSFLHYSELICHLCPGIYDAAPLLEPPETHQQNPNTPQMSNLPIGVNGTTNLTSVRVHGGTDDNINQSGNVTGAGGGYGGGAGGIAVPDIRFRCCLCTRDKIDPQEKKVMNSVWELPSAFRLMVHLRKRHHLCDVCMEPCHSQQKLANHVWKHKLNHFCYRCGIAYRNKADITKHLYWKHGTESVDCRRCLQKRWPHVYHFCQPPAQFPCDECTLTFSRAMCLRVHKRLHLQTIEQQKPYMCTWGDEEQKREEISDKSAEPANNLDTSKMGEDNIEVECAKTAVALKNEMSTSALSDSSKTIVSTSSVCGQRFISRKMLRKHEFRHREPKDDESEQVIVDEIDIVKEDIVRVGELSDKQQENKDNQTDCHQDIPATKEEIESEETKLNKVKVDVYDLPALNLSESDSSDTEDETESKMVADCVEPMKIVEAKHGTIEINELIKVPKLTDGEMAKKTPVLESIWDNFKNYQKSKLDRQSTNPSPSTSGYPMDDEEETPILTDIAPPLTEELVLRDHDYCRVTADTLIEQDPTLNDDNTQISSVDHDYCFGAKENDMNSEENKQNMKTSVSVSPESAIPDKTTNSGSDSDTSTCTCGSNCSCSSSSSSDGEDSSSSIDSSSDSSSSEGRRRQQAKREKKRQKKLANKGRKTSTNITTAENTMNAATNSNNVIDIVDVVKREPLIHESDLETTEPETDEDFYEEQPQRFALKLLAEKREKLLRKVDADLQLNGSLLGSRPVTPGSLTATHNSSQFSSSQIPVTTHSTKKSKKSKSKKKKKKMSRRKRDRSKSHSKSSDINPSHLYAQQFQQHILYQQLQKQQLERQYGHQFQQQQKSVGVVAPITLSLKQTITTTGNTMYGATPATAVCGITPTQMAVIGVANTMASMGGIGTGSLHDQSGNSTPDDGNTRASKRRRVRNKFYGYSSDEEGNTVTANVGGSIGPSQVAKWRKIESPKRPRSPMIVPPITIKTIPPQVTAPSQQPNIPPLRIQHKSSNFSHNRPPRQFHPPNSKYRQKSQSNKRSNTSSHQYNSVPTSNPPPPQFRQQHHRESSVQQQASNAPTNNDDSSEDSSSDDEQTSKQQVLPQQQHHQQQQQVIAPAPAAQPLLQQQPLQHRKGFSLQQQHQQQQRMLNSAVSIGAGVRRGPTGAIVGAGVAGSGAAPVPAAPGVALYCYCRCPYDEVSEMIGCDSDECAIEWFHFECVGIMVPPKGQWFCPDCRKRKQQRREMQLQLQQKQHVQH